MKTALPTIGIRPTIDGRRLGVRESLEDQTMNMAKAAAALIEANIRHASGESRRLRGQIQGQQRRSLSGRYALLVLRQ